MNKELELVSDFHRAFGQTYANSPGFLTQEESFLRYSLITEESIEYLNATFQRDLAGIADALGDQLYIILGTIIKHGLQHKIVEVFEEIHRSNMSKLDKNGLPILREDGKILKSNNYSPPNIKEILQVK